MRLALALILTVLLGSPALAEDTVREKVVAWIEELRSDDFQTREAAREQLKREGLKARDLLEAARDHEDPEVRRTIRAILSRAPKPVTPAAAQVAPGDFRSLGTITLSATTQPLGEVLTKLGAPVWARLVPPEAFKLRPVDLKVTDMPFYAALDTVLAQHKLVVTDPFNNLGVAAVKLREPEVVPAPSAAAGPMRVRVTEVSASRALGTKSPNKYALSLELAWAPFVQVAQMEAPRIEVVRDPDGKAFQPTAAMNRRVTYGVSTSRKHHKFTVSVMPGEDGCKPTIGVLELSLTMNLRYDPARVSFDATKPLPQTQGEVTLHGIEAVEGGRGQYVVDFSAKLPDEAVARSLQAFVVEADGALSTLGVYGGRSKSGDGTVRIRARAYRGSRGAPGAIRVVWHRREERGTLRFRLTDIPLR